MHPLEPDHNILSYEFSELALLLYNRRISCETCLQSITLLKHASKLMVRSRLGMNKSRNMLTGETGMLGTPSMLDYRERDARPRYTIGKG